MQGFNPAPTAAPAGEGGTASETPAQAPDVPAVLVEYSKLSGDQEVEPLRVFLLQALDWQAAQVERPMHPPRSPLPSPHVPLGPSSCWPQPLATFSP